MSSSIATSRVTVDLPNDEYQELRLAAAAGGRGSSMSSVIRDAIRSFLDAEAAEDAADIAFAKKRLAASDGATISTEELNARLADLL